MTRFKKTWLVAGVGVVMLAGAAATGQGMSFWLLAFGLFLFFSVALASALLARQTRL